MFKTEKYRSKTTAPGIWCSVFLGLGACATYSTPNTAVTNLEKPAQTLSKHLVQRMGPMRKLMRVAVLPFTDAADHSLDLGQYMADKVVAALGSEKQIQLIERSHLDQVVKELKLSSEGMVSDDSMKSLGNILGADAIIMGTFTDLGEAVDLNCRIIEPESGRILGSASVTIAQDQVVKRLWRSSDGRAGISNLVVTSPKAESGSNIWPWLTGGLTVVAAGLGTAMGLTVLDQVQESPFSNDYRRRFEEAESNASVASIGFGVAGASALTTILILLLSGDSHSSEAQAGIMPTIMDGKVGVRFGATIDW